MKAQTVGALLVASMVISIVAVDLLFFRNHFRARLIANVAIVVAFAALFFRFARRI